MFEDTRISVVVEPVGAGLHVVRVPLPIRVEPVNCYVAEGIDGDLTIVDTGINYGAAELWSEAIAALGRSPGDVSRIFITHYHPDHIGGSRALADLTGAPVLASAATAAQSPPVWGEGRAAYFAAFEQYLVSHGMPAREASQLEHEEVLAGLGVAIPDRFKTIGDGDVLEVAAGELRVVATPGHADGHLCLYDEAGRRLIAGDHLLERISPAVGLYPGESADPLGLYLSSLDRVAELDVDLVLPGHGAPFPGAHDRARALIDHHSVRVAACMDALGDSPVTARSVALEVFGPQAEATNERFAVTETLAHLELARLRGDGIVREHGHDGIWRYALA